MNNESILIIVACVMSCSCIALSIWLYWALVYAPDDRLRERTRLRDEVGALQKALSAVNARQARDWAGDLAKMKHQRDQARRLVRCAKKEFDVIIEQYEEEAEEMGDMIDEWDAEEEEERRNG